MMKRFTLTLMGLLLFLGGVSIQAQTVTTLYLNDGGNWVATDGTHEWRDYHHDVTYTSGNVKFNGSGLNHYNGLTGTNWIADYNDGEIHTFTVTLKEAPGNNHFVIYGGKPKSGDFSQVINPNEENTYFKVSQEIASNATTATLQLTRAYDKVYIFNTTSSGETLKIESITRTITTASSVAAPTISPASSTYDGELSVTITKGEGNAKVVYSVSGATTGNATDAEFTGSSEVLNLTGTGTITVSATGYDNANHASTTTTCEYTYSLPNGKTNVAYAIPQVVKTAMYTYTFENGDYVSTTGFSSTNNQSSDDNYQSSKNLWLKNDVKNDYSKVNDWDSQVYINLKSSDWPAGTKAILHFAMKSSTGFNANGGSMEIAFQQNSDNNYKTCGIFSTGMVPTDEWVPYNLETTVTDDVRCEKLYFNCGKFSGEFRFDDIILYKVEEAADGGSNVFTSDEQVANIASSAFTNLTAGDYICADVTGTPETIKLTCNGTDYTLTQFNGSTLWGIQATSEMVTALQANNSEFKGHDLTLNGISIYKTKTISESSSDNGITLVNNTFVEQNRPFAANKWNTVCLPYKPTAAQATLLFGTGYQISEFTGVSGTTLEFTNLASIDDFVAGRPYLLMPGTGFATAETSPVVLEDVNITAATPETVTHTIDEKDYSFSGTFNTKSFAGTEWSTTRFVSNNLLMTPNSTDAMKGLRCYFTLPAADGARSFSLGFDEEDGTTSINTVQGSGFRVNGYYNLNGQRVAKPTKGLFIVNGKKVVIK